MTDKLPAVTAPPQRPDALSVMFDERQFAQAMRVADMMANARGFIPPHLAGKKESCFAVVVTALTSGLNPYAIAKGTYQTPGGQVGYTGALVHAMLEASGDFAGPIEYEHTGDWSHIQGNFEVVKSDKASADGTDKYYAKRKWTPGDARAGKCGVTVKGTLKRDGKLRTFHLDLAQCFPLNSTLWATDPQTQICYRAVRGFGNLAVPHIMMGIPGTDEDTGPLIDVTPASVTVERPQLDEEPAAAQLPWELTTEVGETLQFMTSAAAVSALHKALDHAARTGGMELLQTIMDNNAELLDRLGAEGEKAARIELLTRFQELKKSLKSSQSTATSTTSTAQSAEIPSPMQTAAASAAPSPTDDVPADLAPADHRFWFGGSLMIACPLKGRAPDWRMYPLAIGPRIRQAWTAELLSQLWRDNQDTIALFKQAQGDLALANLTAQFADRKRELNPPPPVMQEIDQDIPFDEK